MAIEKGGQWDAALFAALVGFSPSAATAPLAGPSASATGDDPSPQIRFIMTLSNLFRKKLLLSALRLLIQIQIRTAILIEKVSPATFGEITTFVQQISHISGLV